ncbi:hypothetical protein Bca4012_044158 [Brassica carinata]
MPRMHYGRRNTREYAQRRHYDMEGNLVLPMFPDLEEQYREFPFRGWLWRNVYCEASRGSSLNRRGPRGSVAVHASRQVQRGPRGCSPEVRCGVLIKNAREDRSVAGYTEDFINQAKLCKPKNARRGAYGIIAGRKELQAQLRGVLEPLEFALVRRMAGFAMEAEEKIAAYVAALSSMEGGNPGRDVDGYEPRKVRDYLEEFLDTAKRCQPKPAEEWCHLFRAGLRGDIREELVGVLEPLEFALVRRMANQALHAEEWLAESEAEAEYDRVAEGDEDLGSETRCPRHVNVARRYPRDES